MNMVRLQDSIINATCCESFQIRYFFFLPVLNQLRSEVKSTLHKVLSIAQLVRDGPLRFKFSAIERTAATLLKHNELNWNSTPVGNAPEGSNRRRVREQARKLHKAPLKKTKESSNDLIPKDRSPDSDVVSITFEEADDSLVVDLTVGSDDDESVCMTTEEIPDEISGSRIELESLAQNSPPTKRVCQRRRLSSQLLNSDTESVSQESCQKAKSVAERSGSESNSCEGSRPISRSSTPACDFRSKSSKELSQASVESLSSQESQSKSKKSYSRPSSSIINTRSSSNLQGWHQKWRSNPIESSIQCESVTKKIENKYSKTSQKELMSSNALPSESTSAVSNLPILISSCIEESRTKTPEQSVTKPISRILSVPPNTKRASKLPATRRTNAVSTKRPVLRDKKSIGSSREHFSNRPLKQTMLDEAVQVNPRGELGQVGQWANVFFTTFAES